MQLNDNQVWIKDLELQKNIAFGSSEKHHPAQWYKFAEMVMNKKELEPIHQKIFQMYRNDMKQTDERESDTLKNNLEKRRLASVRVWEDFRRVANIYNIYIPEHYKLRKEALLVENRYLESVSLEVGYNALKKCIDPESDEKRSYNEFFDIDADKMAIQNVYAFIEREVLQEDCKIKLSKNNKDKITISSDPDNGDLWQVTVGVKTELIAKDAQIGISILFFSQQKSSLDIYLYKKLFPKCANEKIDCLGDGPITKLKSIISDTNRWLKNRFGFETALHIKTIKSTYKNKMTIKRNSAYW